VTERLRQTSVNKIDLVLAVDNSASMADKQAILALAVPDLITGLVNPPCLDNNTNQQVNLPNLKPTDTCPTGTTREFSPVLDIHIGLVSSSLGTFGITGIAGCSETPSSTCTTTPGDDHGHLVTRSDSCDTMGDIATYKSQGFLAWDPAQKLSPPGIADEATLQASLRELVVGDGQSGCGFESQDESWYRFLIDPTPYKKITFQNDQASVSGIDQNLLDQRQQFLRPDSLLAIIVVSDETDTSVKEYGSYPLITNTASPLANPRSGCNNGPNDPCCDTCWLPAKKGCLDPDPQCAPGAPSAMPSASSLQAFGLISHKQRFGIEFFYQPSRYVNALKSQTITDVNGKQVPNPIFTNLDPTNYSGAVRDPNLVFYAAIVGVPWQLIARQKDGVPDLINGVSDVDHTQVGGFKTAKELTLPDKSGHSYWDDIVGDPENYVAPLSPFMKESTTPRSGPDTITGAMIMPPSTPNGMGAMVGGTVLNDHERTIPTPVGDIEYACIFPVLPNTNPCDSGSCDCPANTSDNPLCYPNPSDSGKNSLQKYAKAYPGLKELAIARGMGDQGIAASICAKQLTDSKQADFGYRPAVTAIIDRLKQALNGQCLPRRLTPNMQGQVQCLLLEGTKNSACKCDTPSRSPVSPEHRPAVVAAEADPAGMGLDCFCEIDQTQGTDLADCQTKTPASSNGWCYVDADQGPLEAAIVSKCPVSQQRKIRFVGNGAPQQGATVFITCAGE
jgi:hypothetical protein